MKSEKARKSKRINKKGFDYYKECPICTSKNIRDKYNLNGYAVSECLSCSGLFVKKILTIDFLKKFYQDSTGDFAYEFDNEECLSYYYDKIKIEIEKIKSNKGTILDVGCAEGFFLDKMKGWERHGTEISAKFANMAREKIGKNIFIGPFEEYPLKKNYFDVITVQDVCDHFINPYENLKKCYSMLKPGGLLIIKVHNISCLYAKITGVNFYAILVPTHLFYFNEKSLKVILNRIGFKFYKSKFIGNLLQLKTIFYRLSREGTNKFFYRIFKLIEKSVFGKIKIHKNLNDIITIFAIKSGDKSKKFAGGFHDNR